MIKHVVMWKYNEDLGDHDKRELVKNLKAAAEKMNGNIKGLDTAELWVNVNPKEPHDLALYCEFDSFDDAAAYQTDPIHLEFKAVLAGKVHDRVCIDCENA